MNLRRLAERASRGIVLKKNLPAEFNRLPMYVTPQSGLRYWRSLAKVDPLLCRTASELVRPGAVVWDVGANVGLFTFCAAARAGASGSVLAIEPDPWLSSLLIRSALAVRNSNAAKVRVLCTAVSDRNKIAELEIADRGRAANHLSDSRGSTQVGGTQFSFPCSTVSLDFLLDYFLPPSILKIDVETHEAHVLAGAAQLIERHRPVIFCEVSGENTAFISNFLHERRYWLYSAEQPVPRAALPAAPWDTLAIPASM